MKITDEVIKLAAVMERIEASNRTLVDSIERLNSSCGQLAGVLKEVRTLAASTETMVDQQRSLKETYQGLMISNAQVSKAQEEFIMQLRASTETFAAYLSTYQPAGPRKDYTETLRTPPPSVHVTTQADQNWSATGEDYTKTEQ